jgi:hypothetical protein
MLYVWVEMKDDSLILPRHLSLRDIYLWDILLWVLLLWGHTSTKLKKAKLLTGLTIALKENYKHSWAPMVKKTSIGSIPIID